jgi:hypothetical protein
MYPAQVMCTRVVSWDLILGKYGHGNYHQAANAQVKSLLKNNNALENDLESCISWFVDVANSWKIPAFEQGRLVICNDVCGQSQ